jgi:hypothetical protein|tara:strand:- start:60 stop:335 length:276 start_codon:yes stop_codon:yes gene_type:complete
MKTHKEILEAAMKIDHLQDELMLDPESGIDNKDVNVENTTIEDIRDGVEYLLDEAFPRWIGDARDDGDKRNLKYYKEEIAKIKNFKRNYLK